VSEFGFLLTSRARKKADRSRSEISSIHSLTVVARIGELQFSVIACAVQDVRLFEVK